MTGVPSGRVMQTAPEASSSGAALGELAVEREDRLGLLERMDHDTGQHRADGMELVLEGGDHAKVPAATPHAPEEVGVLCGAGRQELPVGQ